MTDQKQLTPQQTFQEKIKDRMRADIGDLIPDEALAELMNQAIQEMFFTRRVENRNNYSSTKVEYPSWFEEEVMSMLKGEIKNHLSTYFHDNSGRIDGLIEDVMKQHMAELLATALRSGFSNMGFSLGNEVGNLMANGFSEGLRARGLI